MKMPRLQFPHNTRLFSATTKSSLFTWTKLLTVWAIIGTIFAINRFWPNLINSPPSASPPVLGATAPQADTEEQFLYWEQLTKEKPDYRDAYIKAASLAFMLGKGQKAREFANKALALDPNASLALEILRRLDDEEKQ